MADTLTATEAITAHPDGTALVALDDVSVHYDDRTSQRRIIVDGFCLDVHPGELVCLAGRSGSGKSSLLRVAAGLQTPTSGRVTWGGTAIAKLSANQLADLRHRHVAYLGQDTPLLDHLHVDDNVLLPRLTTRIRRTDRQEARELLDTVGLADRAATKAVKLSGGERQRVALARALFCNCKVLMADEPTSSLDRKNAHHIIELLRQATSNDRAVLVASHDTDLINHADRVIDVEALTAEETITTEPAVDPCAD